MSSKCSMTRQHHVPAAKSSPVQLASIIVLRPLCSIACTEFKAESIPPMMREEKLLALYAENLDKEKQTNKLVWIFMPVLDI